MISGVFVSFRNKFNIGEMFREYSEKIDSGQFYNGTACTTYNDIHLILVGHILHMYWDLPDVTV